MIILDFWLDFDGCANGAIRLHRGAEGRDAYYADINDPLVVNIIKTICQAVLKKPMGKFVVRISSGSNRQTFEADAVNSSKFLTDKYLISLSSVQGLTAIYRTIRNYFAGIHNISVYLDKYLLEDSFIGDPPGTLWDSMEEYIYRSVLKFPLSMREIAEIEGKYEKYNPGTRDANYFDDNKIILINSKAHRAVNSASYFSPAEPIEAVNAYFYDDKIDILAAIHYFFSMNPNVLPSENQFSLHLLQYDATPAITQEHDRLIPVLPFGTPNYIKGAGPTNHAWHQGLKVLKDAIDQKVSKDEFRSYANVCKTYFSEANLLPLLRDILMGRAGSPLRMRINPSDGHIKLNRKPPEHTLHTEIRVEKDNLDLRLFRPGFRFETEFSYLGKMQKKPGFHAQ